MSYANIKETVVGQFLKNQVSKFNLINKNYIKCSNQNFKHYLYAFLESHNVIIFDNAEKAEECYNFLKSFGVENVDFYVQSEDFFNKTEANFLDELNILRIKTLFSIVNDTVKIIITTIQSIILPCINKSLLYDKKIKLKVEDEINIPDLVNILIDLGYSNVSKVVGKGEFSLKGESLSVFPITYSHPYRISFFDNIIEDIKKYDILSGFSIESQKEVEIVTTKEHWINEINTNDVKRTEIKNTSPFTTELTVKVADYVDEKIDMLFVGNNAVLPWFIPFSKSNYTTLLENLDKTKYKIIFDFELNLDTFNFNVEHITNLMRDRKNKGEIFNEHLWLINDYATVSKILEKFSTKYFIMGDNNAIESYDIHIAPVKKYFKNHKMLINDIRTARMNGHKMYIFAGNRQRAESFKEGLEKENIYINISNGIDVKEDVVLIDEFLDQGFYSIANNEMFIGVRDLIGSAAGNQNKMNLQKIFTPPQIGDYVVHEYFGIGLCQGLVQKEINGIVREYILLSYAENAEVSLPIDQLDKIHKYTGSDSSPKLSKLGSGDFSSAKSKARKSINKLAFNLIELYAEREKMNGFLYDADSDLQREIEADFEYIETTDQVNAINDIKNDMEHGKLMDRLICGDVGFGKTEVALRAAVKSVLNNKQVVLIAPTTILARQHYRLFKSRLASYGVNIVEISRLTSNDGYKQTVIDIKKGIVDIVIGTHRVLSHDIEFSDLGLLILDEEQRFGVGQKEKLKNLKKNINVLALSATPIPRTLNLSLIGVRDISVLAEPPKNRLPIRTYIRKFDYEDLKKVIEYELSRDGQIFILNNRIDELKNIATVVSSFSDKCKVVICSGQMPKNEIEQNISDFFDKKANILVSTSIIENGIDVPNANCLIVLDATRYGLSQLYQIRGRIGRSNIQAYAYFYYKEEQLSDQARERLNTLQEFNELGSGFQIALKDLELRGAGNLLGAEQSGHIVNIGYELYCKILDEEIAKAKGELINETSLTSINISLNTYIPEKYITSLPTRLAIYKEISEIVNDNVKMEFINKYEAIYGDMPEEMRNLIDVSQVKNISSNLGITKIIIQDYKIQITIEDDERQVSLFFAQQVPAECNYSINTVSGKIVIDMLTAQKAKQNLFLYKNIIGETANQFIKIEG